jgi:hypothetical protein
MSRRCDYSTTNRGTDHWGLGQSARSWNSTRCDPGNVRQHFPPSSSARIYSLEIKDASNCPIPLRVGKSDHGYTHLQARNRLVGGTWDASSKARTQAAVLRSGYAQAPGFVVYAYPYTFRSGSSIVKRTQCVVVDYNPVTYGGRSYARKGIITTYWKSGHVQPHECRR